jgi:hypothetical protein
VGSAPPDEELVWLQDCAGQDFVSWRVNDGGWRMGATLSSLRLSPACRASPGGPEVGDYFIKTAEETDSSKIVAGLMECGHISTYVNSHTTQASLCNLLQVASEAGVPHVRGEGITSRPEDQEGIRGLYQAVYRGP